MHRVPWHELVEQLRQTGIRSTVPGSKIQSVGVDAGLTDAEVAATESRFGFKFPPDLREFLQTALLRAPGFPDWRAGSEAELRDWFDLPRQGVLFDVECNGFWLEEWGPRPESVERALQKADELIAAAPRLIPVYIHRMIPDEPCEAGNPVFSVHQTDIIIYGTNLEEYLCAEFYLSPVNPPSPDPPRPIRFWDIDRFQDVRWAEGPCITDPRTLPEEMREGAALGPGGQRRKWWRFWT